MENYLKTVLYAYPLLATVGEDYAEHIRNKAVLSYHSSRSTENLAEYLAQEILRKNDLLFIYSTPFKNYLYYTNFRHYKTIHFFVTVANFYFIFLYFKKNITQAVKKVI